MGFNMDMGFSNLTDVLADKMKEDEEAKLEAEKKA